MFWLSVCVSTDGGRGREGWVGVGVLTFMCDRGGIVSSVSITVYSESTRTIWYFGDVWFCVGVSPHITSERTHIRMAIILIAVAQIRDPSEWPAGNRTEDLYIGTSRLANHTATPHLNTELSAIHWTTKSRHNRRRIQDRTILLRFCRRRIQDRTILLRFCRRRIQDRTILLRFLGIILRVLKLEVSKYNVSNHFCSGGGGGIKSVSRCDCE
jgi:hypothetical protein